MIILCRAGCHLLSLTARRLALVSVTRRQHRYKAVPAGYKTIPVQGGYGVVFANPGTNAERRRAGSRYNADRSCYHVTRCNIRYEHWCSVAV
jgi:hypothetical protein